MLRYLCLLKEALTDDGSMHEVAAAASRCRRVAPRRSSTPRQMCNDWAAARDRLRALQSPQPCPLLNRSSPDYQLTQPPAHTPPMIG